MAMSAGGGGDDAPMSDINTTPLVDVMLVLLIIFLITLPVVIQNVELTVPVQPFEVTQTKPENVNLSVTSTDGAGRDPGDPAYTGANPGGECRIYWNTTPVDSTQLIDMAVKKLENEIEALGGRDAVMAAAKAGTLGPDDMPEVHIRGDVNAPYRCIGGAIYQMQNAGFAKVGFISTPIEVNTAL